MRRIVSCDGGGVKGALPARIFQHLDVHRPGWRDGVDLWAGTSVGALNAVHFAAGGTAGELVDLYQRHARRIFPPRRDWKDGLLGGLDELVRADGSAAGLQEVLEERFGGLRLPELETEVLITTFDLASFRPVFLDRSDDWSVVDALRATSAAPTHLPVPLMRQGLRRLAPVDGGVFANNPAERALTFARRAGTPLSEIDLLSFGCGATPYRPPEALLEAAQETLDWGAKQWLLDAPHLLMKLWFDGSVSIAHYGVQTELLERYHRVQPALPEDVPLDDAERVPLLVALADNFDLTPTLSWLDLRGWV